MKNLRHWINQAHLPRYTGPTEAAVLMDVGVVKIDLTDTYSALSLLSKLNIDKVLATLTKAPKGGWGATASVVGINGPHNLYVSDLGNDLDGCCAAVRLKLDEHNAKMNDLDSDPEKLLETLLSTHDWYSAMSDDHSVWAAGEANMKRIRALMAQIDPTKADALFLLYGYSKRPLL